MLKRPVAKTRVATESSEVDAVPWPLFKNCIGMQFRTLPAGTFMKGSLVLEPDKKPSPWDRTSCKMPVAFSIGIHPVTQDQYKVVMRTNPSHFKGANNPVERVRWSDAAAFCRKLSAMPAELAAGRVYRLPTELEWEYACRAGTTTEYCFSDDAKHLDKYAWYEENSDGTTHPVGEKLPNAWGLYDMHGNVWEWCLENWYPGRAIRGGSWHRNAMSCRSASHYMINPRPRDSDYGFRVALSIPCTESPGADNCAEPLVAGTETARGSHDQSCHTDLRDHAPQSA